MNSVFSTTICTIQILYYTNFYLEHLNKNCLFDTGFYQIENSINIIIEFIN